MAVSAVWRLVYFLAADPFGTKGADRSTQARRAVPLSKNPKASCFVVLDPFVAETRSR